MSNKVSLVYENGEYSVCINENVVSIDKDLDKSLTRFKQVIKDNGSIHRRSWNSIENSVKEFKIDGLEINSQFETLAFHNMKYFYNTDKIFYVGNGTMTPLIGGYDLFAFVLTQIKEGYLDNCEGLLELCKDLIELKITYRTDESSIAVSSPRFNYGSAEYNFSSKKISKGASSEIGTFDDYKKYVLDILK